MIKLKESSKYEIISLLKVHTKPLKFVHCIQYGTFKKTTQHYYIFDTFRVKKNLVELVQEKWSV